MSLKQCVGKDGRPGWQWGGGLCHTGPSGKGRAATEGLTEAVKVVADVIEERVEAVGVPVVEVKEPKAKAPTKRAPAKKKKAVAKKK